MKKTEKIMLVKNLAEELKSAESVILVDYSGMNVSSQQELKNRLREVEAKMIVVKNTLFKLAGKEAKLPKDALTDAVLKGQTALVISKKDPISPLSIVAKFAKEFDLTKLKVGIVEGSFQDTKALEVLSKLPGKEALQIQVLGTIAAPSHGLVGSLEANLQSLIYILEQKSKGGEN